MFTDVVDVLLPKYVQLQAVLRKLYHDSFGLHKLVAGADGAQVKNAVVHRAGIRR